MAGSRPWSWAAILASVPGAGRTRQRVFEAVQAHPGLHQAEIARALGLGETTAEHHLHNLVGAGLLSRQEHGGFVRYYPAVQGAVAEGAVPPRARSQLAVLRQTRPLQIAAQLLRQDDVPMAELAQRVGLSPSATTYQVAKMEQAGLVARVASGHERRVRLVDRDGLVRLLLAYEPPTDLVAGFASLWQGLGL